MTLKAILQAALGLGLRLRATLAAARSCSNHPTALRTRLTSRCTALATIELEPNPAVTLQQAHEFYSNAAASSRSANSNLNVRRSSTALCRRMSDASERCRLGTGLGRPLSSRATASLFVVLKTSHLVAGALSVATKSPLCSYLEPRWPVTRILDF